VSVVVLRNVLTDRSVEFQWEESHPLLSKGLVAFVPKSGTLAPQEFTILRIKVKADSNPVLVNNFFALKLKEIRTTKVRNKASSSWTRGLY
jgi:hypothetical protein